MIAVIGDVHLTKSSMDEIEEIFNEIYDPKIKEYWFLGDVFHSKFPHPVLVSFFTKWLKKFTENAKVTIITGNHDAIAEGASSIDYSKYYPKVKVEGINCVLEREGKTFYLGHHFTDQGQKYHRDLNYKIKDLKKYDFVFCGHDHEFKRVVKKIYHLGSIRRVNFSEVEYGTPYYAIIKDGKVEFRKIKSAIPMKDVRSISEAKKLPKKTKVRLVFKSFQDFIKHVNKLPELKNKFEYFTIKHDYEEVKKKKKKQKKKSFNEIFQDYLKTIDDKKVKQVLKETLGV